MIDLSHLIAIPLVHGGTASLPRPWGDREEWAADFGRIARIVHDDFKVRNISDAGKRREGAIVWLTRVAYDLLLPMLEDEQLDELRDWALKNGRYNAQGIPDGLNGFQIGLMAIFATEPELLNARSRERIGKRLWHAARHYVPLEFVVGFAKQLESFSLEQRVARNVIEPHMDGWIIKHRANDNSRLERGYYPERIITGVYALRKHDLGHVANGELDNELWDHCDITDGE